MTLRPLKNLLFTLYAIQRDHSIRCGFFIVDVPEAGHKGVGFQLRTWRVTKGRQLFGVSITHVSERRRQRHWAAENARGFQ